MRKLGVYILECSDGSYYVGVSNNPERRLLEHNEGLDPDSYTFSRRPVEIVWCEFYSSPGYAISIEKKNKEVEQSEEEGHH
jgi:putative endonuclease